jgi:hypothetical protein
MSRCQLFLVASLVTAAMLLLLLQNHCVAQDAIARDVALQDGGVLQGFVRDREGRPQVGCLVSVYQGSRTIAASKTDGAGKFRIENLPGGVFLVASGRGETAAVVRAWAWQTAPPVAANALTLSRREGTPARVVRGQFASPWARAYDWIEANPLWGYGIVISAIAVPTAVIGFNQGDAS